MTTSAPQDERHRPASPWSGSRHDALHRWQLEGAGDLTEVAARLNALAAELHAAAAAGWQLLEPVRAGRVLAARPSRRDRARTPPPAAAPAPAVAPALPGRWRLRLVAEPPAPTEPVLALDGDAAARTPVLAVVDGRVRQCAGPPLESPVLAEVARQLPVEQARACRWGVAAARVGPAVDLVAEGSALRLHAVREGALVRTVDVLAFHHAADGASTLASAAAAYTRLASAVTAMAEAGGWLGGVDDGFVHVSHPGAGS